MQVKDAVSDGQAGANPMPLFSSGREVLPALGLAWANCVNTRIFLSRQTAASGSPAARDGVPNGSGQATAVRRAMQAWAPLLTCGSAALAALLPVTLLVGEAEPQIEQLLAPVLAHPGLWYRLTLQHVVGAGGVQPLPAQCVVLCAAGH